MIPRSDSPGLGVGLPLVAKLAQRFRVETRPTGGTAVSMIFPVHDPV
jgi:anti-sigma regulatory factor (Ser/Thr protein kinase)